MRGGWQLWRVLLGRKALNDCKGTPEVTGGKRRWLKGIVESGLVRLEDLGAILIMVVVGYSRTVLLHETILQVKGGISQVLETLIFWLTVSRFVGIGQQRRHLLLGTHWVAQSRHFQTHCWREPLGHDWRDEDLPTASQSCQGAGCEFLKCIRYQLLVILLLSTACFCCFICV